MTIKDLQLLLAKKFFIAETNQNIFYKREGIDTLDRIDLLADLEIIKEYEKLILVSNFEMRNVKYPYYKIV